MSVWVTMSILAGPEDSTTIETVPVDNASEAVVAIRAGRAVWVRADPWDQLVFDILVGLGATASFAHREIHAARTGVLLPVEDFA